MERNHIGSFSNGLSRYQTFRMDEYRYYVRDYGYIDLNGEMVIEPQFTDATDFDENGNYCAFLRDNRSGEPDAIMDSEGNITYLDGGSSDEQ